MKINKILSTGWKGLASMQLTIACLAALIVLVIACTFAQISLGVYEAVKICIRSFWIYWPSYGSSWRIPIFPGGALVGLLLLLNILAAQFARLERSWRKAGLWVTHLGLILLFLGEFVTGLMQVDSQIAIEEGSTVNYSTSARERELVLIDATSEKYDEVFSIPENIFSRRNTIEDPRLPFVIRIRNYAAEAPPPDAQVEAGRISALVGLSRGGAVVGSWPLSSEQQEPQTFVHAGKIYRLAIRPKRYYMSFSLALKKFRHDVYPGTDIPRNFSSLVRLQNPQKGEDRDVLISMNAPLRYAGKAFYQASFGKNDTLSVLQVVENPGWLLPYLSCLLVGLGLAIHFLVRMLPAHQRASL